MIYGASLNFTIRGFQVDFYNEQFVGGTTSPIRRQSQATFPEKAKVRTAGIITTNQGGENVAKNSVCKQL